MSQKYGNLTRAAAALNTSQPAVTRVIHKLEADLGCRLFIRSKSGMELTAEGSRFFEYVSAGCLQFFRAESHLSDLLQLENGSISISATETALHSWLFEAMENFHEEYPGVHFQILNHSTQDSIQAVRDGKVDFAVVSSLPLHISEPLRMKKLHTYRDILISGKRFSELKGHPVSLRELASYPWISLTSESISRTF
ncbi:MAG: LysR family transcriptional regulator [Clostridium sp.]